MQVYIVLDVDKHKHKMCISANIRLSCDNPELFLRCLTMFIMEEDFTGFNGTQTNLLER